MSDLRSELQKFLETLNIQTTCVEHPPVKLQIINFKNHHWTSLEIRAVEIVLDYCRFDKNPKTYRETYLNC